MNKDLTLTKTLEAYRVLNTPGELSWKQHYAKEKFSNINYFDCTDEEKKQYIKRLDEGKVTICDNIRVKEGRQTTLTELVSILCNPQYKNIQKANRKVCYSSNNGVRPIGSTAYDIWSGFQCIDMDIKDREMTLKLKKHIFNTLYKCNWFLGCAVSSSGTGLHIYTKITVSEADKINKVKNKLLFLSNFRHKYSYIYLACVKAMKKFRFSKDDLIKWLDLAMFKPQQGIFISYDPQPLINTNYFEDFIYVNFDSEGEVDVDWMTYPDLKDIFKRWEWFEKEDKRKEDLNIEVREANDPEFNTHNKIHYRHTERWKLANTLVKLYGLENGTRYLRMICSNAVRDTELQSDCITASRHQKPIDLWAVSRLNTYHGFNIKLNIQDKGFDEESIFSSMNNISNPTLIQESKNYKEFHIDENQYLGDIKNQLLNNVGRITLLEAGAGVGKTEMVKQLVNDNKKIIMVMPFTSTIKAKVENVDNWYYSYGNRAARLDMSPGLALTIDKFSHLNLMDIKTYGYDYIFIDESHLLFQSEYRTVMPKVIEMIRNAEIPIILMSGTPSGELVFFPDAVHLKVIKKDVRKKVFNVNLVDTSSHLMYHMARQMADEICKGRRILYPTNKGTLYSKQIKAAVTYFMRTEHANFEEVRLHYYKKSNMGENFMDDVNFKKTISDTQILLCTNYLSVGVDILDKFDFSIFFGDLFMPQETEQFANRLRSHDLYINLYVAKNDAEGNSRSLDKYRPMNFQLNNDELRDVHSILRLCNEMIERNPIEYRYNSLISSIISKNKFIEYNETDNKYYLNEIAYKVIIFERKYREYIQQLPVMMKGMEVYGYEVTSRDLNDFKLEGAEMFNDLKTMVKIAYDEQLTLNAHYVTELLEMVTEDRLSLYKEVLKGKFEIRKGKEWKENLSKKRMTVKSIEVFEKVIPICISFSKQYTMDDIREIFDFCQNKNGTYNFSAIGRIRMLVNIVYNNKNKRLDLPIRDFMIKSYEFADLGRVKKTELTRFVQSFANKYADKASNNIVDIVNSRITMDSLYEIFENIFKCLVSVSREDKKHYIKMSKIDLLWKEKINSFNEEINNNSNIYIIEEFLNNIKVDDDKIKE